MNTVISQALATGLPVITTRHSGLPDQVKDTLNGLLVDEGDYEMLAQKILEFLEHPDRWPAMSRLARKHVEQHYNSRTLMGIQVDCYNRVVEAGTAVHETNAAES